MSTETHPPVSEAMREAVAREPEVQKFEVTGDDGNIIYFAGSAWFCFEAEVTAYQTWAASEIARITGERDAKLAEAFKLLFDAKIANDFQVALIRNIKARAEAAEAETARLRAALEAIEARYEYGTVEGHDRLAMPGAWVNGYDCATKSRASRATEALAALSSQEKTDG